MLNWLDYLSKYKTPELRRWSLCCVWALHRHVGVSVVSISCSLGCRRVWTGVQGFFSLSLCFSQAGCFWPPFIAKMSCCTPSLSFSFINLQRFIQHSDLRFLCCVGDTSLCRLFSSIIAPPASWSICILVHVHGIALTSWKSCFSCCVSRILFLLFPSLRGGLLSHRPNL